MPSFLPGYSLFAVAGLVAAAGPVLIHLMNRRRYRVIEWAAMDFLLAAVQRNRRILQLRDLLLLALRTLCVLLFGLAMARPYFSSTATATSANEPVHVVLLIDNSLSMGYERLDGTLLDEARAKALEFIERLPPGSRTTVLPICGSSAAFSHDAYRTVEDARDALRRIELVDRSASVAQAADLALEACNRVPELPSKRIILIGDQQLANWPAGSLAAQFKPLPEIQFVQVAADRPQNAWVADFHLQDGIADVETPASLLATIRYSGDAPRQNVPVSLVVDNVEVATQTVDLEPGQAREVRFSHRFDLPLEPGQTSFAAAAVRLPPDQLPADDFRVLSAPVVAALPVAFVDQYGQREDPAKNEYGETYPLRRLLAPVASRADVNRQLVQIRRLAISGVDESVLRDVRLVVIAGIEDPGPATTVLREFVAQGGQLLIAAGGAFDPAAWTNSAWLDGAGILPLPLKSQLLGRLPQETAGELQPFWIAPESLVHDYFYVDEAARQELDDLYREPLFFKSADADARPEIEQALLAADVKRIEAERSALAELDAQLGRWLEQAARGGLSDDDRRSQAAATQRRSELHPDWLLWKPPAADAEVSAADLALSWRPRILAAFTNKAAWLIERQLGKGHIVFAASGVQASWNTLAHTDAMLIFDRILRAMLSRTLPPRNHSTLGRIVLPIDPAERRAAFLLTQPSGTQESLTVEALGGERYGVTIRDAVHRGVYRLSAARGDSAAPAAEKLWETPLAVNGPERESELMTISADALRERMGDARYRWIGQGDSISLEGALVSGQDLWKWLMLCVLLCLLAELALLGWPQVVKERPA